MATTPTSQYSNGLEHSIVSVDQSWNDTRVPRSHSPWGSLLIAGKQPDLPSCPLGSLEAYEGSEWPVWVQSLPSDLKVVTTTQVSQECPLLPGSLHIPAPLPSPSRIPQSKH